MFAFFGNNFLRVPYPHPLAENPFRLLCLFFLFLSKMILNKNKIKSLLKTIYAIDYQARHLLN